MFGTRLTPVLCAVLRDSEGQERLFSASGMLVLGQPRHSLQSSLWPTAGITPQIIALNITVGPCELGRLEKRGKIEKGSRVRPEGGLEGLGGAGQVDQSILLPPLCQVLGKHLCLSN